MKHDPSDTGPPAALSPDEREELRRQFEREYIKIAAGAERGAIEALVQRYAAKGITKRTAFRWLAAVKASPVTGEAMVSEARRRRAARRVIASGDGPGKQIAALLPELPTLEDAAELGMGDVGAPQRVSRATVMERLESCLVTAEQVMEFAKTPEGAVRNAKLLLVASEHLRRNLETVAKLHDRLVEYVKVDRFQEILIEEIEKLDRETAERVVMRVQQAVDGWLSTGSLAGRRSGGAA